MVTVAKSNTTALSFNQKLGYVVKEETRENDFLKLVLTKEMYYKKTIKLKRAAELFCNGDGTISIKATESDKLVNEINTYLRSQTK